MRNHKGFSFTEILVAAAMLGGISLGVMQLMNNMQKGQKSSEIKMEVLDLRRRIVTAMADKFACEKTFGSKKIGDDIDVIKNAKGVIIVKKNQEVANKRLKITRIYTKDPKPPRPLGNDMREIELHVDFENLMKNHSYGAKKTFKTLMKVEATGANAPITRCFDDRENAVMTAIDEAGGELCRVLGGKWDIGETLNKRCTTAPCGEGEYLSGTKDVEYTRELEDGTKVTTTQKAFKCKPLKVCEDNEYQIGFDANGVVQCKSYTTECEEGKYLVGYDSNGDKICQHDNWKVADCQDGHYLEGFQPNGDKICRPDNWKVENCPNGEYLAGFQNNGNKICKPDYRNVGKCPKGSYLEGFNPNGSKSCASFEDRAVVSSVFSLNVNDSDKSQNLGKHLFCASAGWGGPGSNDSMCEVSENSGNWRLQARDIDNDDQISGSTTCRAICIDFK